MQIGDGIWITEGDIVDFYSFAYPTRSVIIRLGNGDLWVWSPVKLTPALKHGVDELGPVAHLVSPNKIHHLYLQDWNEAYAKARLWGPRSTIRKRTDLSFQSALNDDAPPDWRGEIDQVWFRGSFLLDEVEFFHRASRTAIITDFSQSFSDRFLREHWRWWQRPIARLWKITKGFAPLEVRLSFLDRKAARTALQRLLSWDAKQVIVAHGDWKQRDGAAYLKRAFSWV